MELDMGTRFFLLGRVRFFSLLDPRTMLFEMQIIGVLSVLNVLLWDFGMAH